MRCLEFVVLLALGVSQALACDFKYDPVAISQYYRSEGWQLPGINDFNPRAPVQTAELPSVRTVPGFIAQVLPHSESPYVITFPAQEFSLNSKRQRMRAAQVKASVVRWMKDRRIVAYTYGLIPVGAHRENDKWVIDVEAGCIFDATFIDDKGDGVFRVLVPGDLTADLVPAWAIETKN